MKENMQIKIKCYECFLDIECFSVREACTVIVNHNYTLPCLNKLGMDVLKVETPKTTSKMFKILENFSHDQKN